MNYQERLLALGEDVFHCPNYAVGGACRGELADVSGGLYRHGPEISFVGESYGQSGTPRILFTRLNPTWNKDIGWFGTLESVREYRRQYPDAGAREIFESYMKGWEHGTKQYRGMWDAGTVTGHRNQSRLSGDEKRRRPRYGIQVIMEEMIRHAVFPKAADSPLQYCAINNVVKCAGSLPKWNPSTSMCRDCNYYEKEIDILAPHILVAFGKATDRYLTRKLSERFTKVANHTTLRLSSGAECLYFVFPHPTGQGKNTWRGNDVRHLHPDPDIDREPGPKEKEQFKCGPRGGGTSILFKYILYLVSEARRLKDCLANQ